MCLTQIMSTMGLVGVAVPKDSKYNILDGCKSYTVNSIHIKSDGHIQLSLLYINVSQITPSE